MGKRRRKPGGVSIGGGVTYLSNEFQLELKENPFAEILQVDLVADILLSFLCLDDMKLLSVVSWEFLQPIRKSSKFHELIRLHLCREVMEKGLLKFEEEGTYSWRNVSMDLAPDIFIEDNEERDSLGKVLEAVHSLNLYLGQGSEMNAVGHHVEEVLKRTKSLKGLGHAIFTNSGLHRVLHGLSALEIYGPRNPTNELDDWYDFMRSKWRPEFSRQNIIQLSKSVHNLTTFSFSRQFDEASELSRYFPVLLDANKRSLEVIEVCFLSRETMENIQFPQLKRLKLYSSDGNVTDKVIESFLLRQPELEELDIFFTQNCDFQIVEGLQRRGKLCKLRRLRLGTTFYVEDSHPMDWSVLRGMTALKDFSLSVSEMRGTDRDGIGEKILLSLLRRTERISIQGCWPFWPWRMNVDGILSRFGNLQELDLLGSHCALNDNRLQSVILNCPKLRGLRISKCLSLTDYGLTGRWSRKGRTGSRSGVSLNQLKGLAHLRIRDCPGITRKGLLAVMKFKHLRSFDYVEYEREANCATRLFLQLICHNSAHFKAMQDKEFLSRLTSQNPCLTRGTINSQIFRVQHGRIHLEIDI